MIVMKRPGLQRLHHVRFPCFHQPSRMPDAVHILLKHDLLGRVTEALRFQPTEVRLRPAPPTRIHPTVSQQEGIEPLSYPTLGVLEVFSATHQITDRFLLFIRNPDRH